MKIHLLALVALVFAPAAQASPCKARIDALQARFNAAPPVEGAAPVGGTAAPETADAKLHRQPTAASAADGGAAPDSPQTLRDARIRNRLFDAQAAENSGDVAACEAAVAAAERELR